MAKTETKNSRTATGEYYDGEVETIVYLECLATALINDELLDKRNEESEAFTDKIHSLEYLLEQESRKHKRQMLLSMAKQAKYMALYYRLEFMSTGGELFRRKWRQFELFRKKAKELE